MKSTLDDDSPFTLIWCDWNVFEISFNWSTVKNTKVWKNTDLSFIFSMKDTIDSGTSGTS